MHPDERNMADSMMRIRCDRPMELLSAVYTIVPQNIKTIILTGEMGLTNTKVDCLNPQFFAYGQMSIYIGYIFAVILNLIAKLTIHDNNTISIWIINSQQAVLGLRIWSAIASCIVPFILIKMLRLIDPIFKSVLYRHIAFVFFIFSSALIQFAHFGTTEAVLALWYVLLVYRALVALDQKNVRIRDIFWMSVVCGLGIGTKISSVLFIIVPCLVVVLKYLSIIKTSLYLPSPPVPDMQADSTESISKSTIRVDVITLLSRCVQVFRPFLYLVLSLILIPTISALVSFIVSPHNIISLRELLGSMRYESDVGLGRYVAFYTRQFLLESAVIFQLKHVFPYVFGSGMFVISCIGLIFLPYRRQYNLIRFAILVFTCPTIVWYAKWTRFLAPVYPLMLFMAVLVIIKIYVLFAKVIRNQKKFCITITVISSLLILPSVAFLAVYSQRDVRFVASDWVYSNIPANSKVLSETANVIDIPIPEDNNKSQMIPPNYGIQYLSFNSYEVDDNANTKYDLFEAIRTADYIFVPSRRVYYNHTCIDLNGQVTTTRHSPDKCKFLAEKYPTLNKYYADLFSGKLGFDKVAEFSSYPRISIFGKTLISFPDEFAEETFTVFDHPVIRVYKRVASARKD